MQLCQCNVSIQRGLISHCYYGKCVKHLNARIGPLTQKKVKSTNSFVSDHVLASFDDFYIPTGENKMFLL